MEEIVLKHIHIFLSLRRNRVLLSILIGLIGLSIYTISYGKNIQDDLKNHLIRFHVLANSDTDVDQDLKIYVKNEIIKKYRNNLLKIETREEALEFLKENKIDIKKYGEKLIEEKGFEYNISIDFEETKFPTKTYGAITLPEGEYLAFRVLIGSGQGQNYWCVMYPPLCFVEGTYILEEDKLKENLSKEELDLIKNNRTIKFKIVELLN